MSVLASIGAIVGAVALGLLVLWVVGIRRAAKSAVMPLAPTPDEAKIEAKTTKTAGDLMNQGAGRAQEVTDANQQELLALARKRWFPGVRK